MLEDTADVVQRHSGQATIFFAGKQVLAILEKRHVNMHTRAVVTHQWFRHERGRSARDMRCIVGCILQNE